MNLISLFSGAGGMDLGFKNAGFKTVVANEYDKKITPTFKWNFPDVKLIEDDIRSIRSDDFPNNCVGIIGGPPCQSWSAAGSSRGIDDDRGKLFFDYIRIVEAKRPIFFVAENVPGILSEKHRQAFRYFIDRFNEIGYDVRVHVLNASDHYVPQDRKRVFFIGFLNGMDGDLVFVKSAKKLTMRDAIYDLRDNAVEAIGNKCNKLCKVRNHEYYTGSYSPMFMSRNRVRSWDEQAFTIQASGRQCQLHPSCPKMEKTRNGYKFVEGYNYRRLTVREAARIQTYPDDFGFLYDDVDYGYKMVGNSVPVNLAYIVAMAIKRALKGEGKL